MPVAHSALPGAAVRSAFIETGLGKPRRISPAVSTLPRVGEGLFSPDGQVADADVPLPVPDIGSGVSRSRLCVGMATYDDFDGVWFTIQAICLYQPDVLGDVSFLVIDNHPEGPAASALRALEEWLPNYRYIPFDGYRGTAVRDLVFREATADIVCCLDSHVLLRPGALAHLLEWFGAHPYSRDLLQGPLLYDNLKPGATHLEPTWGAGMFGQWGLDPRIDEAGCEPFEIAMHGLGLFACRRDAWPGLNPRLRGFGGEEGYLHEKFRQRGGRVLCHPQLAWLHRFSRPAGVSYPNAWEDRVRNYVVAWSEIGWDLAPIQSHFCELLGPDSDVDAVFERARRHAEHPVNVFDGVFCLASGADGCDPHAHPPGISWRIERLVPGLGLDREHRRLAGWHDAVSAAARRGYQHLLLLDESASVCVAVPLLEELQWDLCLLPVRHRMVAPDADSNGALADFAVALHGRAFKQLLSDLPAEQAGQAEFLTAWGSVDGYIAHHIADGTFTGLQALPAGPDADQPQREPGIEVTELAAGLVVRPAGSPAAHQLNNTASVILELCDGRRTVKQIAGLLAEAFELNAVPLAEVTECVAGLRSAGILADPMHYPATTRIVTGQFLHQSAESRTL
jgi:Coenzyme PQQ synthesis protein D (PqqD)/Glycosyl transferase family 2